MALEDALQATERTPIQRTHALVVSIVVLAISWEQQSSKDYRDNCAALDATSQ